MRTEWVVPSHGTLTMDPRSRPRGVRHLRRPAQPVALGHRAHRGRTPCRPRRCEPVELNDPAVTPSEDEVTARSPHLPAPHPPWRFLIAPPPSGAGPTWCGTESGRTAPAHGDAPPAHDGGGVMVVDGGAAHAGQTVGIVGQAGAGCPCGNPGPRWSRAPRPASQVHGLKQCHALVVPAPFPDPRSSHHVGRA